jgi:hypothetical protein
MSLDTTSPNSEVKSQAWAAGFGLVLSGISTAINYSPLHFTAFKVSFCVGVAISALQQAYITAQNSIKIKDRFPLVSVMVLGWIGPAFLTLNFTLASMLYSKNSWLLVRAAAVVVVIILPSVWTKHLSSLAEPANISWRNITVFNGFSLGYMATTTACEAYRSWKKSSSPNL